MNAVVRAHATVYMGNDLSFDLVEADSSGSERPVVRRRYFFKKRQQPPFLRFFLLLQQHTSLSLSTLSLLCPAASPASLSSPPTRTVAGGEFSFLSPLLFVKILAFLTYRAELKY